MKIIHPFAPIYDSNSEILILGSFPSVKSRNENFYYANPYNRFWKLIAKILNSEIPVSIDEKKKLLVDNKIAIWDVIYSCEIEGSLDTSIKNPKVNDIYNLLKNTKIKTIVFNGKKSYQVYNKYIKPYPYIDYYALPSTSPTNASYSFEKLYLSWKDVILNAINDI